MLDRQILEAIRTGRSSPPDLASIVIPHYRTEELVRLCLRAVRRMTDHPFEAIVVDNNSRDASLEYLRGVRWIRLIERGDRAEDNPVAAHGAAMDEGLRAARGRWLVSLHTDTIIRRRGWLGELITRLKADPRAACLGSGKIDTESGWYRAIKALCSKQRIRAAGRRLLRIPADEKCREARWYPRSYCAIYDLERVRSLALSFRAAPDRAAGELLYQGLLDAGSTCVRLAPAEMQQFVEHVGHATALIGRGGLGHWRGNQKVGGRLRRVMASGLARELLGDESLDR